MDIMGAVLRDPPYSVRHYSTGDKQVDESDTLRHSSARSGVRYSRFPGKEGIPAAPRVASEGNEQRISYVQRKKVGATPLAMDSLDVHLGDFQLGGLRLYRP